MNHALLHGWGSLFLAIVFSVIGTVNMKLVFEGNKWKSIFMVIVFYILAFVEMTFALRYIELSMLYAVWSGLGTILVSGIGMIYFNEAISTRKIIFLILIVIGVIGMHIGDYSP